MYLGKSQVAVAVCLLVGVLFLLTVNLTDFRIHWAWVSGLACWGEKERVLGGGGACMMESGS